MRRLALPATLVALLLIGAGSAGAQVVLPLEPAAVSAEPGSAADAAPAPAALVTDGLPGLDEIDPGLRRLPASLHMLRFEGETGYREWPVYLTTAQAAAPVQLQVGYINAVSVMAEASRLTVSVNDADIGEITIASSEQPARTLLDVPVGLLQPGFNSVGFRIVQRHRVDCTIDGAYELWTQIYPGMTGLAFLGGAKGFDEFSDIAAINPDADGSIRIRVRTGESVTSTMTQRMLRVAQQVALASSAVHAIVDFNEAAGEGPGIEIAVGTPAEIQALGVLQPGQSAEAGVSLLLPTDLDLISSRVTLLAVGSTEAEIDRAIASLDAQLRAGKPQGTEAGLRALANVRGRIIKPGESATFRELGVRSEDFNGRFYRSAFSVRMPSDFLAADYDKAILRMEAGYAPGLGRKSELIIRVNGVTASVFPLVRSNGEIMRGREITIPLHFLHPGQNRIELEGRLYAAADESCDALAAMHAAGRLVIIDNSEFELPKIARLARMPDLAATFSAGFPYAEAGKAVAFIPHPDRETLGAAATLAASMAAAAGTPLNLSVSFSAPPIDAGSALVIGALRDLPPAMLDAYGLSTDSMQTAWRGQMLERQFASIDHLLAGPEFTGSSAPTQVPIVAQGNSPPQVSLDDWQQDVRQRGGGDGFFGRIWKWVRDQGGLSKQNLGFYAGSDTLRVKPDTTLVLAQSEAPSVSGATWTLVTAPNSKLLSDSISEITDPNEAFRIGRQAVAYNSATDAIVTAAGANGYFVMTQGLSFGNLRLIAAGWFSLNIGFYVLALLAACTLLGTATWLFVRQIGHGDD